jgi:hypothetical protein
MAIAYDLIVVGQGKVAAELAARAVAVGARVAQVVDPQRPDLDAVWEHVGHWQSLLSHGRERTLPLWSSRPFRPFEADVSVLGLDRILESWRWERPQVVRTATRLLTARHVIVVDRMGVRRSSPLGLERCPVLTPSTLCQSPTLPLSLIIVGGDGLSCAIAQILSVLGVSVTLVANPLLPGFDRHVARLVTQLLGELGVSVYAPCRISALEPREGGTSVEAWLTDAVTTRVTAAAVLVPEPTPDAELPLAHARHWRCQTAWQIPGLLHRTLGVPLAGRSPRWQPLYCAMTPPILQAGNTEHHSPRVRTAQVTTSTDFYKIACTPRGQILGLSAVGPGATAALPLLEVPLSLGDLAMGTTSLAELARKVKPPRIRRGWLTWCRDWNLP